MTDDRPAPEDGFASEIEPSDTPEDGVESETEAASLTVRIEQIGEAELRAVVEIEGEQSEVAYLWQQCARSAEEAPEWQNAAQGETLDAAALLGDAYADYSYRCIATVGESSATSATFIFPSPRLSECEDEVPLNEEHYDCEDGHHDFDYENAIPVDRESHRVTCKLCGHTIEARHFYSCMSDSHTCELCGWEDPSEGFFRHDPGPTNRGNTPVSSAISRPSRKTTGRTDTGTPTASRTMSARGAATK